MVQAVFTSWTTCCAAPEPGSTRYGPISTVGMTKSFVTKSSIVGVALTHQCSNVNQSPSQVLRDMSTLTPMAGCTLTYHHKMKHVVRGYRDPTLSRTPPISFHHWAGSRNMRCFLVLIDIGGRHLPIRDVRVKAGAANGGIGIGTGFEARQTRELRPAPPGQQPRANGGAREANS